MSTDPGLGVRPCRDREEWPQLVTIWRSAVEATHHFLTAADIDQIEDQLISVYFPSVTLLVAETPRGIVGFAGMSENRLEMLFVHADTRGRGVGTALLRHAISDHPVVWVDVNEQNPEALGFYQRHGFVVHGRSQTDAEGRPFPLLHLVRVANGPVAPG